MIARGKRAALYLRVSTSEQSTENQRPELEDLARRRGLERARRRGRRGGRPPARVDVGRARELLAGGASTRQAARELDVPEATLRRALRS